MLGLLAGTLTTAAWLPQLLRTWRSRHADDVSKAYLLTFGIGVAAWLAYGIASGQLAVILANAVTLVLVASLVWLKLRGSGRQRPGVPVATGNRGVAPAGRDEPALAGTSA